MGASLIRALAIAILCLCPPDNLIPLSPTIVSSFLGYKSANLLTPEISAIS